MTVRRALCLLVLVITAVALLGAAPAAAGAAPKITYRPPVVAPIIEHFRAPPHPYGPGNRGVDYLTQPGSPVVASAAGRVTFAGPVAGRLVVVVRHADGLRTTYDGLATVSVHAGDAVDSGEAIGTATDRLHFGVRDGTTYLDPELLFAPAAAPSGPRVRLVPTDGGPARARGPT